MPESIYTHADASLEGIAARPIEFSVRSNVLLYELPGLGSEGHFLLIDLVTGQYFGLSSDQAAIIRTLQILQETVPLKEVSETCAQKFGISADYSTIHSLLKDLDDLALIKRDDLSREAIAAKQLKTRRAILEHLQCGHLSSLLQWMKDSLEFYKHNLADHLPRISRLEDVLALPVTTREDVRQNLHKLLPAGLNRYNNINWRSTSETTIERMQTVHVGDYLEEVTQRVLHLNPFFDAETFASPMCVLTTPVCSGLECHRDMNVPYERRLCYGLSQRCLIWEMHCEQF